MSLTHISETIPTVAARFGPKQFKPADAALMDFEEVQALSPSEQVLWMTARQMHLAKLQEAEQAAKKQPKSYKCLYCLDKNFVFVLPCWAEFKILPYEFSEETIAFVQHLKTGNIAIPCDCHPHQPNTFYNLFGSSLRRSHFGFALVSYRRKIAQQRKQETEV